MKTFEVWSESADMISGPHRKRAIAERSLEKARADCAAATDIRHGCGNGDPDSSEDPAYGTTCGVLDPHGVHISIFEDGRDITAYDYGKD